MYLCKILDLGLVEYSRFLEIQRKIVEERKSNSCPDTIILLEHENVFTLGRCGNIKNLLVTQDQLIKENISVFHTDRGGDLTYHGHGQIVIYPIFDLKESFKDIKLFLGKIENSVIKFLKKYNVTGSSKSGKRGVWIGDKKIASIGVAFTNWISYHGVAVNLNTDMEFFKKIRPCGFNSSVMISLAEILNCKVDISDAKCKIIDAFSSVFQLKIVEADGKGG